MQFEIIGQTAHLARETAFAIEFQPRYQEDKMDVKADNAGKCPVMHGAITETGASVMDFVFTVCDNAANETCPVWPGQPMSAHWGVPDPAAVEGTETEIALAFAETYRMLAQRISIFCSLPLASIDRLSLQQRLDNIGKTTAQEESA